MHYWMHMYVSACVHVHMITTMRIPVAPGPESLGSSSWSYKYSGAASPVYWKPNFDPAMQQVLINCQAFSPAP